MKYRFCSVSTKIIAGALLFLCMAAGLTVAQQDSDDLNVWWSVRVSELRPEGSRTSYFARANLALKMNLVRYYDVQNARMFIFNMDNERFWINKYRRRTIGEGTFEEFRELTDLEEGKRFRELNSAIERFSGKPDKKGLVSALKKRKKLLDGKTKDFSARVLEEEAAAVQNHPTRKVEVSLDGGKVADVWVAKDITPPDSWGKFVELAARLEPEKWKAFTAVEGLPLKAEVSYAGFRASWELRRISTEKISPSYFLLSKGFEVVEPSL